MPAVTFVAASSLSWSERPGRELLKLAWPITISMLSFSAMTLVSTAFVASVGADQLAGVGLAGVVGFALICFGVGLLRGAKTLVSQAIGADRRDKLPELLGAAIGIALILGVVATIAGHLSAPLLAQFSASPRAGAYAAEYLEIFVGAGLFWLRVMRGGWRPAAAAARRAVAGIAV